MIMIRKARPRRQPNRVTLVELDGTPVRQSAADWPAWTDNWFWDPTPDADLDDHFAAEAPDDIDGDGEAGWVQAMVEASLPPARFEPTAEDLAWLAALEAQEAAEKARVVAAYRPLPTTWPNTPRGPRPSTPACCPRRPPAGSRSGNTTRSAPAR